MSYDSSNLTTPDIKWLGVRPSDLDRFNIPQQCRLPMTDEDIRTGKRLVCHHHDDNISSWSHHCAVQCMQSPFMLVLGNPSTAEKAHFLCSQLEEDFIQANPEWVKELEIMISSKVKAEIQALSSFGFQYLSQVYLPLKLQEGDWI